MANENSTGAGLGFEKMLWDMADQMRGHMDPAECKHVVLGLIFLKYISDAFQDIYDDLASRADTEFTDPEDPDEYVAQNAFWVPKEARWQVLQDNAKTPEIGRLIDEAMDHIERANPKRLRGVLPKDYGRPELNMQRSGQLIDMVSTIELAARGQGATGSDQDVLGRVYEYFLGQFAV